MAGGDHNNANGPAPGLSNTSSGAVAVGSNTNSANNASSVTPQQQPSSASPNSNNNNNNNNSKSSPHIRIVPHIADVRHCLYFDAIDREVPESTVLKVGRFTDKVSQQMSRVAFRSKVVSRSHAEIWTENGQFFIKDTKSSSGTFLNHMRLSPAGVESRPHPLNDGDILQLGVDYQGGTMDVYKCVKIRLEINRIWQRAKENPFRRQVLDNIRNAYHSMSGIDAGNGSSECCICLYQMVAFQALFVAPCSHCFHFKCVKPILFTSTGFTCPLCRTYADLEASVTIDENEMDVDAKPPPMLPAAVQSQHSQPAAAATAATANAQAAVEAAESGGNNDDNTSALPPAPNSGGIPMDREDATSTPVPSGDQAAIDSFGTTPVGSMPNNLTNQLESAVAAGGGGNNANQHNGDPSMVAASASEDATDSQMQIVSSPPSSASVAACRRSPQQHQTDSPPASNAA